MPEMVLTEPNFNQCRRKESRKERGKEDHMNTILNINKKLQFLFHHIQVYTELEHFTEKKISSIKNHTYLWSTEF